MNNHHTFSAAVLIIRLNPDAATAIWRLAAPCDAAQTGEWHPDAGDPTLSLLAQRHPAWVLVPASDCAFHRVTLPAGARRNAQQALAFLLEEQLATEIEESHFALIHRDKSDCAVAVVGREKMRAWQAWCEGLGLNVLALTPDALALPQNPTGWSAVRCGEQWLFRCETCSGMAVETAWLGELLVHWPDLAPIGLLLAAAGYRRAVAASPGAGFAGAGGEQPAGAQNLLTPGQFCRETPAADAPTLADGDCRNPGATAAVERKSPPRPSRPGASGRRRRAGQP